MNAHTPGPWHVVNGGRHWNSPDIPNHRIAAECTGTHSFNVAWSPDGELVAEHVYEEADARLMAAAPELLSIAEKWEALDGGAWLPERHAREKAELLAETRATIAAVTEPAK